MLLKIATSGPLYSYLSVAVRPWVLQYCSPPNIIKKKKNYVFLRNNLDPVLSLPNYTDRRSDETLLL